MASIGPFINSLGETGYIQTRTLGARNPVTNQPAVTFSAFSPDDFDCDDFDCSTKIKVFIDDIQTRETTQAAGRATEKILRGYVGGNITVNHLDLFSYHDEVYEVSSTPTIEYLLGEAVYKKIELVRRT